MTAFVWDKSNDTGHNTQFTLFFNSGLLQSGDVWICCCGCWLVDKVHGTINAFFRNSLSCKVNTRSSLADC